MNPRCFQPCFCVSLGLVVVCLFVGTSPSVTFAACFVTSGVDLITPNHLFTIMRRTNVCLHCVGLFVSSELLHMPLSLLVVLDGRRPFTPRSYRSIGAVYVALLLLMSGVEPNPGPSHGSLRLGLLNICTLNNKDALVHDILGDHHLDILALNETRLLASDPPAILLAAAPEGYDIHLVCRPEGPRGGGLAIVCKSGLLPRPHSLQDSFHPTSFEFQSLSFASADKRHLLVNLYRPPSTSKSLFLAEFSEMLELIILAVGSAFTIVGDLNMPGSSDDLTDVRFSSLLTQLGLQQHTDQITRGNNLLDLILSPCDSGNVGDVRVQDMDGTSDHALVSFSLASAQKLQGRTVTRSVRSLKCLDRAIFMDEVRSSDLFIKPAATCDEFYSQLHSTIVNILDRHIPLRPQAKRVGRSSNHWLTPEARRAKKTRRKREREWRRSGLESDRLLYRKSCRDANDLITSAREEHFKTRLDQAKENPRKRWSIIKELLHSKPSDPLSTESEDEELCTSFGEFFISKITRIRDNLKSLLSGVLVDPFSHDSAFQGVHLSSFSPVSVEEVRSLLRRCSGKSSPLDFIPTSLLKECEDIFAPLISHLANLAFGEGCFPAGLKLALVTPLLKKPGLNKNDPANFRPISNLNTIGKLLERLVLVRLQPHLTESPGFNRYQSAYRRGHSTETALLRVADDVLRDIDNKRATLFVALDLSAAFDTIDHSVLLRRLESTFGITGNALSLLGSYLHDRSQFVRVGSRESRVYDCTVGVPQGSVLGPLLFSAFIAPVARVAERHGISQHQYADDTSLYISVSAADKVSRIPLLERCLADVRLWFNCNCLALNPEKSEVINISPIWQHSSSTLVEAVDVAGSLVKSSSSIKYLGVTLDSRLSFDQHVAKVAGNAFYHIRALRHIRRSISLDCAKDIACAIVGSRLDYCNALLHGTTSKNLHALQRVQNTAARVVTGARVTDHIRPVLRSLHWLPIQSRTQFKIATITYKALNLGTPRYLAELLSVRSSSRSLRSSSGLLLDVPFSRTVTADRAFSIAAPRLWNSLDISVRSAPTLLTFKSRLKTCLFAAAYN